MILNDLMGYDGLKIYQDPEMFNFSIDSMLLASFATISKKTNNIIDLCTGNAPIPMYLSLRTNNLIYGVEVQKAAYDLAVKSVDYNKLNIRIINDDLKGIHKMFSHEQFDLVTCNPPFFKVSENSNINKNDFLTIARHEVMATLDDIVKEAFKLLKTGGYLAMVHRPDRLIDILETFRKYKIEPKRLRFVYPRIGSQANHVLIEGIKNSNEGGLKLLPPLYVYENDSWSEEIKKIYNYKKEC